MATKPKSILPKVEIKPISSIKFRDDNPRAHSDENLELIERSLSRNKAGRSILIDEKNQSLAGEGTTRAARKAGIKEVVVVEVTGDQLVAVKRTDLTEAQKEEMIVFDNRTNETSEWDNAKTAAMLSRMIIPEGTEIGIFGFTEADLEHFTLSDNFDESKFEEFFTPAEDHHQSNPGKMSLHFVYEKKIGEKVLKALAEFDPKPEIGLLKALKLQ